MAIRGLKMHGRALRCQSENRTFFNAGHGIGLGILFVGA